MSQTYIHPNIKRYSSFEEVISEEPTFAFWEDKGAVITFDDLLSYKRVFVGAEPGYGKTRLLKELIVKADTLGLRGVFVDLKRVKGGLERFILEKIPVMDCISDNLNVKSTLFKTDNFALKNNRTIVCLDALDEVKLDNFSNIVDEIKDFSEKYENISIFISSRYHHFKKYKELFVDMSFEYVKIEPFTRAQVYAYFEREGIDKDDIDKIVRILQFRDRNLVIQSPRYLEMMAIWIKNKGIKKLKELDKTELFEWFIYKKLEIESEKLGFQKKELIKRILEKIALLMEMYQTNILTKEELMTIFDDVKSNLNITFLHQVPIEFFYERSLLKDNIDTIEFENTEFQEYLAAKEIVRLGRVDQIVFDLAVDNELREIFPSWFNTLSFLVDIDISILKLLLIFGSANSKVVQDEEYHRLLTKVNVERLTISDRKEIFKNIFMYYQKILHWIPYDVAKNLTYYFDKSQEELLKATTTSESKKGAEHYVRKGNVAYLIAFLLERGVFDEAQKQYWQDKLIRFAKDNNKNGVLQRHAIFALSKFKDIRLLKKVSHLINSPDELIARELIEACIYVEPDDLFSIEIFVAGTKRKEIQARYGLYQVKAKKSVKKLLQYFIEDEEFLQRFIEQESIFKDRDWEIIENIKNVWDGEIAKKIKDVIIYTFAGKYSYQAEGSSFIKGIIELLGEKEENSIFYFVKALKENKDLQKHWLALENIFALLLKKQQVGKFVSELKDLEHGKRLIPWVLQKIAASGREDAKDIYEEGRKYFPKEYGEIEKSKTKQAKQPSQEDWIYKEFKFKLEPEKGKYDIGVFRFYLINKERINKKITLQDKQRLRRLIEDTIFKKFDPGKQKLTINKKEKDGGLTYTTHNFIPIFGDCLIIAQELGINISKYRQKVINYIPFAYSDHLGAIFSLVPALRKNEIESLLSIYSGKRKDDLSRFMPSSFIESCKTYKIKEALPILKRFVDDVNLSLYERRSALEVIATISSDKTYLRKIFNQYKKDVENDTFQLAEVANKYLIEKFSDDLAIKWRFQQLKKRAFPFTEHEGVHEIDNIERELWDKKFARPLMSIKTPQREMKDKFLDLLEYSFRLLKKGENYWRYATYLWEIVIAYFDNLKETKSYAHLKDLENYVIQHSSAEGINWLKGRLKELRRKYMFYIGKPQSIAECIKKYNRLKETQYIDIATPVDLFNVIKDVFEKDIKTFVESEGFYRVIELMKKYGEGLIQKTLKTQIENGLLKRGFRESEVSIRREEQLLDDKRTDFLVSYGFIGPILIEIKLTNNKEVYSLSKRKEYKKKFLQYMKGYKAYFGLFILFQIKKEYPLQKYLPLTKEIYKDCNSIEVIGLNCLKNA